MLSDDSVEKVCLLDQTVKHVVQVNFDVVDYILQKLFILE